MQLEVIWKRGCLGAAGLCLRFALEHAPGAAHGRLARPAPPGQPPVPARLRENRASSSPFLGDRGVPGKASGLEKPSSLLNMHAAIVNAGNSGIISFSILLETVFDFCNDMISAEHPDLCCAQLVLSTQT